MPLAKLVSADFQKPTFPRIGDRVAEPAGPPGGGGVNKGDLVAEPAGPPGGGVNKGDRVAEPTGPPVKGESEIKLKYINL